MKTMKLQTFEDAICNFKLGIFNRAYLDSEFYGDKSVISCTRPDGKYRVWRKGDNVFGSINPGEEVELVA